MVVKQKGADSMSKSGADLSTDGYLKAMVVGASGSGKTNLIGEGLKYEWMQSAYVFDTDLRLQSLAERFSPEILGSLTYDSYRDLAHTFGGSFAQCQAKKVELTKLISTGHKDAPRTIVVDSVTFLAKLIINEALKLDGKKPDQTPGLQHYGHLANKMERFISELAGLPCNVIVTVHEKVTKDEVTGQVSYGIALTQYLRNILPGYFNEVWHTTVQPGLKGVVNYEVHPRPVRGYPSRTCYPFLEGTETHEGIWKKLNEKQKTS
jgi:hypothetical protein